MSPFRSRTGRLHLRQMARGVLFGVLALLGGRPAAAAAEPPLLAPLSDGRAVPLSPMVGALPSPAGFLGRSLGERFTRHDQAVRYLEILAAASDRVRLQTYGETPEGRPLLLAAFSSSQNLGRLEEIRQNQLRLADPRGLSPTARAALIAGQPAVVWLAYGVHGNEASSGEAALALAWTLAAGGDEVAALLDQVVVLLDPAVNPDGHERYVSFVNQEMGGRGEAAPLAAEHDEPWPGGRTNHNLVDLNRDWAWATQPETRGRLAAYRAWEPLVYVDFHEMDPQSSYFFPPAAEPVHPALDPRSLAWLERFGRANGEAFDRLGWRYFAHQEYDLFYPAYGDTYPGLRGAVGMTYEMAGGGSAGTALTLADGRVLTLADRVGRHLLTSLTTLGRAAAGRAELLADFAATREAATTAPAKVYLWSADEPEGVALAELLGRHGIGVQATAAAAQVEARLVLDRPVGEGAEIPRRPFPAGTLAASTAQPLGNLLRALLDPAPMPAGYLERQRARVATGRDSEFYDVTAWSLAAAYGVQTWEVDGARELHLVARDVPVAGITGTGSLGYLVAPAGLAAWRLEAGLQRQGIRYRVATEGFSVGSRAYPAGSLVILGAENDADPAAVLGDLASATGVAVDRVASSSTDRGVYLGSRDVVAVHPSRIGVVAGEGVSATSFGSLWTLLDSDLALPVMRIAGRSLADADLAGLDVLVLPDGRDQASAWPPAFAERLTRWVEAGGVVIGVGRSVGWLRSHELASVKSWEPPPPTDPEDGQAGAVDLTTRLLPIPGVALTTRMATGHPLTLGLGRPPLVLFQGAEAWLPLGDPRGDVLVATEDPVLAGFAWPEAEARLANALLVGSLARGRGGVVLFAQDPAFRGMWRATMPLFLNAALRGPSLGVR
jgi:hypothetical protein